MPNLRGVSTVGRDRGVARTRHGRMAVIGLFKVVAIGENQGLVKREFSWRRMQAGSTSLQGARENREDPGGGRRTPVRLLTAGDSRRDQPS